MERQKAITTAAAASLTLLAGAAGIALNSGIVGAGADSNVGQISPVTTPKPPITRYVEDQTAVPVTNAPEVHSTDSQPITTSSASAYHDDDRVEHETDDHDEHESDHHAEYQGADDDD
jgi:hypothetical protein